MLVLAAMMGMIELKAIVQTAATMGRKVTAPRTIKRIDAALRAGIHSIEHGSFLDAETAALSKKTMRF